ncbi:hypothetical protein V8D89_006910 [Ganoderma adspersum]
MQTTTVGGPRGLPDLNFDILLQIISLLTTCDVAHLTRTCHALRNALSAELPREGVTLEGRHLSSFLTFTDAKHGRDRLSYFQDLVLPGSTYETISSGDQAMSLKDVKRALSAILQSASSLQSLSILDLNAFSFPPKELKTILDSLPRLQELEMSGIQKKYEGILVDVLPRLRTLGLDFLEESDANTFLTSRQSDSLQEVVLYNAVFNNLKNMAISLPAVHTLRACPANLPSDVDALTHMFPNVKDLVLDFPRNYSRLDPEYRKNIRRHHLGVPSQSWSDAYEKSCRDRLLARPKRKADAWPHIQSLRIAGVGTNKLGWLGLTCHVPRVEVCSWRVEHTQLAGMLKEQRPRCLLFHPGTLHGLWGPRSYGWSLLFALQFASSVTRLAVVLCKETMDSISRQTQWLVTACAYLEKSSVSFLLLRLHFGRPVSNSLSDQLDTWRATMSDKIPSLQIFLFQIEDQVHLGWMKKRGGWVKMTEDEARKLVASENIWPTSIEPCERCERCAPHFLASLLIREF